MKPLRGMAVDEPEILRCHVAIGIREDRCKISPQELVLIAGGTPRHSGLMEPLHEFERLTEPCHTSKLHPCRREKVQPFAMPANHVGQTHAHLVVCVTDVGRASQ